MGDVACLSGALLPTAPVAELEAATKQYVDSSLIGVGSSLMGVMTANATKTSNTTFGATGLSVSGIPASARFALDCYVIYSSGTTGDMKFFWDQIGVTGFWSVYGMGTAQTAPATATLNIGAFPFTNSLTAGGSGGDCTLAIRGTVLTGSGGGLMSFQFAQNVSDTVATIVRAGSWMRLTRLS